MLIDNLRYIPPSFYGSQLVDRIRDEMAEVPESTLRDLPCSTQRLYFGGVDLAVLVHFTRNSMKMMSEPKQLLISVMISLTTLPRREKGRHIVGSRPGLWYYVVDKDKRGDQLSHQ